MLLCEPADVAQEVVAQVGGHGQSLWNPLPSCKALPHLPQVADESVLQLRALKRVIPPVGDIQRLEVQVTH